MAAAVSASRLSPYALAPTRWIAGARLTYFIIATASAVAAAATYGYGRHRQRLQRRNDARRRLSRTMAGARAGGGGLSRD